MVRDGCQSSLLSQRADLLRIVISSSVGPSSLRADFRTMNEKFPNFKSAFALSILRQNVRDYFCQPVNCELNVKKTISF
jgi:hypothetical protein